MLTCESAHLVVVSSTIAMTFIGKCKDLTFSRHKCINSKLQNVLKDPKFSYFNSAVPGR